uniref:Uncharacterized protein n=1 Tax=Arundo donax TaxID=35708 RepID=A0A0A9EBC1_ARUDO
MGRSRTDVLCSPSQRTGGTLLEPLEDAEPNFNGKPRTPWSSEDFSVDSGRSQNSGCTPSLNDDAASISGTTVVGNDDISEAGSDMRLLIDSYDHISSRPHGQVRVMCYSCHSMVDRRS